MVLQTPCISTGQLESSIVGSVLTTCLPVIDVKKLPLTEYLLKNYGGVGIVTSRTFTPLSEEDQRRKVTSKRFVNYQSQYGAKNQDKKQM